MVNLFKFLQRHYLTLANFLDTADQMLLVLFPILIAGCLEIPAALLVGGFLLFVILPFILLGFVLDLRKKLRHKIAKGLNTPPFLLSRYAKGHLKYTSLLARNNPKLPLDTLLSLSSSGRLSGEIENLLRKRINSVIYL